jgi:hypothetical protein
MCLTLREYVNVLGATDFEQMHCRRRESMIDPRRRKMHLA